MEIVRKSRILARQYKLFDHKLLYHYTVKELRGIYNGCGPEFFPAWIRRLLDSCTAAERPAILIHDVEFERGGSIWGFVKANIRLFANCWICAGKYYSPGSPLRWHHRRLAIILAAACMVGGWRAWKK